MRTIAALHGELGGLDGVDEASVELEEEAGEEEARQQRRPPPP